jgi:hypothetical protein
VNLLLLHQSFVEFLPFDDDSIASLSLTDLPSGFDLIINGHLHWTSEQNLDSKRFLLTGSSIFTQMKNLESKSEKGVFLFDSASMELKFVPFKVQRKLFYEKMKFSEANPEDVKKEVFAKLSEFNFDGFRLKPLVRLRIIGTLAKGFTQSDVSIDLSKYSDKAIFSVSKDFSVESFQKKIESLKLVHGEKRSVSEFGVDILEKNVIEAGLVDFDTRRVFELLSVGEIDKVESLLISTLEK